MKYRNEIILAVCFIVGNFVASWPGDITGYAERSESQARTDRVASVSQATGGLLASATPTTALTVVNSNRSWGN